MEETNENDSRHVAVWQGIGSDLNLPELEDERKLNVQCVNSSEFVVGKQTNFNGPVTIINCAQAAAAALREKSLVTNQEKVVIRDQVLSRSAAMILEEKAGKENKDAESSKAPMKDHLKKWKHGILSWLLKNKLAISVAILVFLVLTIGLILTFTYFPQEVDSLAAEEESKRTCMKLEGLGIKGCIYSVPYEVATRCENPKATSLEVPVSYVAISETKGRQCYYVKDCLEALESADCDLGLGCNYLVGSDGNMFEVRGWNFSSALQGPHSEKTLLICLMGDFDIEHYPTYPQTEAAQALIAFGVENNYISEDYVLWAENATSLDGDLNNAYRIIKKWPKFRRTPFPEFGESSFQTLDKFPLYTKKYWGGENASSVVKMKLPVPYVVVSHSVTPECYDLSSCPDRIRNMQSYHFSKNLADIAYNFLVDSGGHVYEGRGWNARSSVQSFVNGRNINVCLIGDFSRHTKPTKEQFEGLKSLIDYALATRKIRPDYSLIAANSTSATLSPGKMVYEEIKTWPHFDPYPRSHLNKYDN